MQGKKLPVLHLVDRRHANDNLSDHLLNTYYLSEKVKRRDVVYMFFTTDKCVADDLSQCSIKQSESEAGLTPTICTVIYVVIDIHELKISSAEI